MVALKQVAEANKESQHSADLECILLNGDLVYSTADDGMVKIWNKDLVLQKEFKAHDYAVYHLLIFKDRLFSASIDSTIKVWNLATLELLQTLTNHEQPVRKLATNGKRLFSGDERGNVVVFNGDSLASENRYETVEELWDLAAWDNLFFTVRDRGLSVTEVKEDDTNMYTVVKSLQGRAPIYVSAKYLVYSEFGTGYGLLVHQYQPSDFPKLAELRAHERIVTCMSGGVVGSTERVASSGYDNKVFLWDLASSKLLTTCETCGVTPSALAMAADGAVYVGGPDGYLVKMMTS